jgi:hypothetical protein
VTEKDPEQFIHGQCGFILNLRAVGAMLLYRRKKVTTSCSMVLEVLLI